MAETIHGSINFTELTPSASTRQPEHQVTVLQDIPWLCVKLAILFFGALGNIVVCGVINRRLKNRPTSAINAYVFNLALADLGMLLLISPFNLARSHTTIYWPFGEFVCRYILPLFDTFYGTSIWMITAIAIDRYLNIVHMVSVRHDFPEKRVWLIVVALSWLLPFLIVSLPVYILITFQKHNTKLYCYMDLTGTEKVAYETILMVFTYALPLSVITWTYYKIWNRVHESNAFYRRMELNASHPPDGSLEKTEGELRLLRLLKHNAKVKIILTPVVVAFAVTMFPLNLLHLLSLVHPQIKTSGGFMTFIHLVEVFTTINSAINPIIYSLASQEFRNDTKAFLHREHRRNRSGSFPTSLLMMRSNEFPGRSRFPSSSPSAEFVKETPV